VKFAFIDETKMYYSVHMSFSIRNNNEEECEATNSGKQLQGM